MKPLTPTKRPQHQPKAVKSPVKLPIEATRRPEAQCCAKTSRTAVGCHD